MEDLISILIWLAQAVLAVWFFSRNDIYIVLWKSFFVF